MRVLVVAAHPDDEVLGCGGAIARFVDKGDDVAVTFMGNGVRLRGKSDKRDTVNERWQCAIEAARILGAKILGPPPAFPDNSFDAVPMLTIAKTVTSVMKLWEPQIVLTHHRRDLNVDHRLTAEAVLIATRPGHSSVSDVYAFFCPSSTEWAFDEPFKPNLFVNITSTLERKLVAMEYYKTEIREYPHPRSIVALKATAQYYGVMSGVASAEPFEVVRMVR